MNKFLDYLPIWVSLAFFIVCVVCSPSWSSCTTTTGSNPNCSVSGYSCKCETYPNNAVICGVFYGSSYSPTFTIANCSIGNGYYATGSCQGDVCFCTRCNTQCEVDSIACVNSGKYWLYDGGATCGGMSCQENTCDTTMNCIEYPFNHCVDVPSTGEIYCDANGCTGLPYSKWWSEYRTECSNACGDHETNSLTGDTLVSFNSSCDDETQCSEETKCVDFPNTQSYLLYKVCIVGNTQIGNGANNQSYTQIVDGGRGSCASVGMPSNNIHDNDNSGSGGNFPNQNNDNSISDNCLIYGFDCPPNFVDSTNYNDNENRTPDHCICEPLDGSHYISSIICPDGSRSTFFGSCNDWKSARSSSSAQSSSSTNNPPESSCSGSENPPTSSGGISGEYPDWVQIKNGQKTSNDLLGSMVQTLKTLPSSIVNGVKEILNGYNYTELDEPFIWDRVDSLVTLDTIVDTAGVLHAIFHKLDTNNRILDTIPNTAYNGCPCVTFFPGNTQASFGGGHITFKEIKINLGNISGFNLCTIIRIVVVSLASVVSFFIGFSIFRNISQ